MHEQSKIRFPADLQIKYDGLRALSYWDSGEVRFLSRSGKYFDLPHLRKILEEFLPQGHILDGELYHHGTHLQTINSWVKRRQRETLKLSYRTYDCPEYFGETGPWRERRVQLEAVMAKCPDPKTITLVKSVTVNSLTEAYEIVENKFMVGGYEGGILRLHSGYYNYSKRSNDLLKLKLFDEEDFEIIGFKGGEKGTREENAVIWRCKTEAGKEFDVRPTGTYAEREEIFKQAKKYLGKMYSVKFKGYTIEGKPFIPVGLAFKEDR
jgi:ATP-dependent DNA ligase